MTHRVTDAFILQIIQKVLILLNKQDAAEVEKFAAMVSHGI